MPLPSEFALRLVMPGLAALLLGPSAAADPAGTIGSSLRVQGDYRLRYETLDPQFRTGYSGRDQALVTRGRIRLDVPLRNVNLTAEIMDSRASLNDQGSPVYTSTVNTLELVQASVNWDLAPGTLDHRHTLSVGIMTKDVGSRRLIARNRFRNTLNTFAGLDWQWSDANGRQISAFYLSPLRRLPDEREALLDNERQTDAISHDTLLAGVHIQWPTLRNGTLGELLAVRSSGPETRIPVDEWSELTSVGLRFSREPVAGHWDFDIESAIQYGRSRAKDSHEIQDHNAYFAHASAGYLFAGPSSLRLAVQYDYASGDKDPTDNKTERFDPLYGARRFDFGPTGIYGPFVRSNLQAIGFRSTFRPAATLSVMLAYQRFHLASATDSWPLAGLRDRSGASGKSLGRQLESAMTWVLVPGRLSVEVGLAYLRYGPFAINAPNASGRHHSTYTYSQLLVTFGG